jgi:hypothetical protein
MNILRSRYVQSFLLIVCQIITFIVVYESFWRLYRFLKPNIRRDIAWGIVVEYSVLIFAAISLAGAIIGNLLSGKYRLLAQCFCILSFACFFLGSWQYAPYRTSFLLGCGIVGFLGPFFLLRFVALNLQSVNERSEY